MGKYVSMAFRSRSPKDPGDLGPLPVLKCVRVTVGPDGTWREDTDPPPPPPVWADVGPSAQRLQDHLGLRVARLPVERLRKWWHLAELRAVESDHVARLSRRHSLSDDQHMAFQTLWFVEVDEELSAVTERLRRIEWVRQGRMQDRMRRLGRYHLGQLYWNTFGPGGGTWFGDHVPVRRFLFRLRWRP